MMELTTQFKHKVRDAILENRERFGGSDASYAKSLGINPSAYSQLKKGKIEKLISDSTWLQIGRTYEVSVSSKNWKIARTKVYNEIEDNLHTCQKISQSMILVDECGIGKTECAKHIVNRMKNAFYVDCSQAKTRIKFVKHLARILGVDDKGKHEEVKENVKYALNILQNLAIVLDEAGDLEYNTLLVVKELWNASEGNVGWYMMGADGLKSKVDNGMDKHKVGFAEIFSRFSEKYIGLVPKGKEDKRNFYVQLIGDVAFANSSKTDVQKLVNKCYDKEENRNYSLRYLKTLILLKQA